MRLLLLLFGALFEISIQAVSTGNICNPNLKSLSVTDLLAKKKILDDKKKKNQGNYYEKVKSEQDLTKVGVFSAGKDAVVVLPLDQIPEILRKNFIFPATKSTTKVSTSFDSLATKATAHPPMPSLKAVATESSSVQTTNTIGSDLKSRTTASKTLLDVTYNTLKPIIVQPGFEDMSVPISSSSPDSVQDDGNDASTPSVSNSALRDIQENNGSGSTSSRYSAEADGSPSNYEPSPEEGSSESAGTRPEEGVQENADASSEEEMQESSEPSPEERAETSHEHRRDTTLSRKTYIQWTPSIDPVTRMEQNTSLREMLSYSVEELDQTARAIADLLINQNYIHPSLNCSSLCDLFMHVHKKTKKLAEKIPEHSARQEYLDHLKGLVAERNHVIQQTAYVFRMGQRGVNNFVHQHTRQVRSARTAEANPVNPDDVLKFAHLISKDYSVVAPPDWTTGSSKRPFITEADIRFSQISATRPALSGNPIIPFQQPIANTGTPPFGSQRIQSPMVERASTSRANTDSSSGPSINLPSSSGHFLRQPTSSGIARGTELSPMQIKRENDSPSTSSQVQIHIADMPRGAASLAPVDDVKEMDSPTSPDDESSSGTNKSASDEENNK